jgi:hypothetical protein
VKKIMMFKCKLTLFDNNFFVSFKGHIFDALTLMSLTPSQLLEFSTCFFLVQTFFPSYKLFCYTLTFVIKWMCDTDKPHFPLKRKTHFFLFFSTCFEKFLDCWMSSEAKSRSMTRLYRVPWRSVGQSSMTFYRVLWSSITFFDEIWQHLFLPRCLM